jgi:ElaB/YqjD/DUF883 family membrane-anchored ribosome-binding protein
MSTSYTDYDGGTADDGGKDSAGAARKLADKAKSVGAAAQERLGQAADSFSGAAAKAQAKAKDLYGQASVKVRDVAGKVPPAVKEKPYAALGVALGVGVVAGMLMAGRGPKVIEVRPRD